MQYNLLVREIEYEVTDVCKRVGIGLLPWSPLKGVPFLVSCKVNDEIKTECNLDKIKVKGVSRP